MTRSERQALGVSLGFWVLVGVIAYLAGNWR